MPLRLLLCDDEPLALDRLAELASRCADVIVAGTLQSGPELIERLGESPADVVLLDIEMPRMDGFDVVEALARIDWNEGNPPPLIIFVTAHREFAVDAFDSGALDFISKPVRLNRLEQALTRARRAIEQIEARRRLDELSDQIIALKQAHPGKTDERHVWVGKGTETIRLALSEVDWVGAEGEYVRLHAGGESYLERGSMTETAAMLEPAGFVRIHRSVIVNSRRVSSIEKGPWGDLALKLVFGTRVPVGKKYRAAARALRKGALPGVG